MSMKRVALTVTGTVAGVSALLSFKTETHPVAGAAALPSASLTTPAAAASPSPTGSRPSTVAPVAKSYLGAAVTTRYGVVQVRVTVNDQRITNVQFAQLTAFDGHSAQINSDAGPQLLQETLNAQSADIDTVSGATYTSDGYRRSLQAALDQAGVK